MVRVVRAACSKERRDGNRKQRLGAGYHTLCVHLPPEVAKQRFMTLAVPASDGGHERASSKEEEGEGRHVLCWLRFSEERAQGMCGYVILYRVFPPTTPSALRTGKD